MEEVGPLAIVQCDGCLWWWFFWDRRPTIPFTCDFCKLGLPPWEPRTMTPLYGTAIPRKNTPAGGMQAPDPMPVKKKRKRR